MRIMPRRPLPLSPAVDAVEGLAHIERLTKLHLSTVLAEGIREPLAVLRRMVELDTELISRQLKSIAAYEASNLHVNGEPSYEAKRGQAIVEYTARATYERVRAA